MSSPLEKISIGTSGWSYKDWVGPFYPEGTPARDYLPVYTEAFSSVEVDSTFYALPRSSTVQNWATRTPDGFRFALKVPGSVTHGRFGERPELDKVLRDEAGDLERFLDLVQMLGPRLGPIVFQFPYFRVREMACEDFCDRLAATVGRLPRELRFAVELRNKSWIKPALLDLLREHSIALVWIDHPYMPSPSEQMKDDRLTTDFAYVRLLGDRYGIEKKTKTWGEIVVDKSRWLEEWIDALVQVAELARIIDVYTFANNHFAGHGPATCRQLRELISERESG